MKIEGGTFANYLKSAADWDEAAYVADRLGDFRDARICRALAIRCREAAALTTMPDASTIGQN